MGNEGVQHSAAPRGRQAHAAGKLTARHGGATLQDNEGIEFRLREAQFSLDSLFVALALALDGQNQFEKVPFHDLLYGSDQLLVHSNYCY
jgi:hypothetical protein